MGRIHFIIVVAFSLLLTLSSCQNAEALKEEEMAKIRYESWGCFGGTKITLTFTNRNGITFAKVQSDDNSRVTRISKIQTDKLDTVITAIKRLKKGGFCTSSIKYTITTKSESFVKEDEGCQFTGFTELVSELFRKPD